LQDDVTGLPDAVEAFTTQGRVATQLSTGQYSKNSRQHHHMQTPVPGRAILILLKHFKAYPAQGSAVETKHLQETSTAAGVAHLTQCVMCSC
jgi:hypothetical protein